MVIKLIKRLFKNQGRQLVIYGKSANSESVKGSEDGLGFGSFSREGKDYGYLFVADGKAANGEGLKCGAFCIDWLTKAFRSCPDSWLSKGAPALIEAMNSPLRCALPGTSGAVAVLIIGPKKIDIALVGDVSAFYLSENKNPIQLCTENSAEGGLLGCSQPLIKSTSLVPSIGESIIFSTEALVQPLGQDVILKLAKEYCASDFVEAVHRKAKKLNGKTDEHKTIALVKFTEKDESAGEQTEKRSLEDEDSSIISFEDSAEVFT
jgi:hypothetical protein